MTGLSLVILRHPSGVVVAPRGVVDFASAPVLRAVLFELIGGEPLDVVLDLAAVDLMDGHSIGMLAAVHRRANRRGASLRVRGAAGRVLRTLEISGLELKLDEADPEPSTVDDQVVDRTVESLLLARAHQADRDDLRAALRELAIEHAHGLAIRLARRYRGRGEPLDDLTQVAVVGLIKAVDGFDPQRTTAFTAYAVPTIIGEIKRYFRDKGWQIRVPRRPQEIRMELGPASGALAQRLGRSPTVPELAEHLGATDEEVLEAIEAAQLYRPGSLSTPMGGDDGETPLLDRIGVDDRRLDLVDYRESLRPLLAALPARQRAILAMRFYGNMTQSQIAAQVGLSQMHVSRLLSDALRRLRHGLTAD